MNRHFCIRLAFAAHRVSDTFQDVQLKQETQNVATNIASHLLLLVEDMAAQENRKKIAEQALGYIAHMEHCLTKAQAQEGVRPENFAVLEQEYEKAKHFVAALELQDKIEHTAVLRDEKKQDKEKELTERQKKILAFLQQKHGAQVREFQKILPQVTKRTLRRDLDNLLQRNLVERKGEWNTVMYELKKDAEAVM
jgi:hypothetical protein